MNLIYNPKTRVGFYSFMFHLKYIVVFMIHDQFRIKRSKIKIFYISIFFEYFYGQVYAQNINCEDYLCLYVITNIIQGFIWYPTTKNLRQRLLILSINIQKGFWEINFWLNLILKHFSYYRWYNFIHILSLN